MPQVSITPQSLIKMITHQQTAHYLTDNKKTGGPVGGRPFLLSANSQWLIAKGLDYFITLVVVVVPSV